MGENSFWVSTVIVDIVANVDIIVVVTVVFNNIEVKPLQDDRRSFQYSATFSEIRIWIRS